LFDIEAEENDSEDAEAGGAAAHVVGAYYGKKDLERRNRGFDEKVAEIERNAQDKEKRRIEREIRAKEARMQRGEAQQYDEHGADESEVESGEEEASESE